jgi:hypothetical protein
MLESLSEFRRRVNTCQSLNRKKRQELPPVTGITGLAQRKRPVGQFPYRNQRALNASLPPCHYCKTATTDFGVWKSAENRL